MIQSVVENVDMAYAISFVLDARPALQVAFGLVLSVCFTVKCLSFPFYILLETEKRNPFLLILYQSAN